MSDRYVVVGLAPARAEWFRAVAHWCNAASLPAEFVKCVSAEQVRALVAGGRAVSALLVDGAVLDRELIELGVPVLVVDDGRGRDWGAAAVLPARFGPDHLLDALGAHAARVGVVAHVAAPLTSAPMPRRGRVVAVCGPGGTGASTVAIALAQSLPGPTLLADFALHAEQAMLHDARDVTPGVQELVEAFRSGRATSPASFVFRIEERGYDLLLGLRQAKHWPALRPRSFEAAFDAVRRAWATVVCDTDADVEGEKDCGSVDVEDRNVMARACLGRVDAVVVVGLPGLKGAHSLIRVVNGLLAFGVDARRIVPVVNRAPRSLRARSELARALAGLVGTPLASPVFVPDRRLDDLLRDGGRLPPVVCAPLARACLAVLESVEPRRTTPPQPELITPGSLGAWSDE
jgi:hypothetical protein